MKTADMHRALILRDALDGLQEFLADANDQAIDEDSYEHQRVLSLTVGDRSESGVDHASDIDLDIVTGRKLVEGLQSLIEAELKVLGVKPQEA